MASIQPEADIVYITSAEVLSVRERMHSPKRYVYEASVDWSDSNTTTCYRGYTDFFDLQCELLSMFPFEAGAVKGVPRTIPYLPGRKIFQRSTAALAEKRLPQIDDYVRRLVAMPEKVSRSEPVLKFFRANWQEDRLRGGSFSVPRQTSRTGLLFHEEGAVEYTVRRLDEEGEGYGNSYSISPPSGGELSSIQELVEGETSKESNGRDTAEQRENDSAKNTQQNTRNSAYGTII